MRIASLKRTLLSVGFLSALLFALTTIAASVVFQKDPEVKIEKPNDKSVYEIYTKQSYWDKIYDPVVILTFFLVLSTIFLWFSTSDLADFAEKQAEDMRESLSIARKSAKISEDALLKLERASVFLEVINIVRLPQPANDENRPYHLITTWKNGGRSATRAARAYVSWRAFPDEMPEDFPFPNMAPANGSPTRPTQLFLGPGALLNGETLEIPPNIIKLAASRKNRVYVWGWFEYNDIFEDTPRHRTEFCSQFYVIAADSPEVAGGSAAGVFRLHHKHNGADGDCMSPLQT